jgi:hypothetical protein
LTPLFGSQVLVAKCLFGGDPPATLARSACGRGAKQSHPGLAQANAPQTLTQKASAESCCEPQDLYLPMLLEISFQNCSRVDATIEVNAGRSIRRA